MTSQANNLSSDQIPLREQVFAAFSPAALASDPAAAAELEALVPAAAPQDFAQLQEESTHHRVLVLRHGAVIAVTTLISIGGAFLLHSLFAGVFILGYFFSPARSVGNGSGGEARSEGGSDVEVLADLSTEGMAAPAGREGMAADPGARAVLAGLPEAPKLPDLPNPSMFTANPLTAPEVQTIPTPVAPDFGTVKAPPPQQVAQQQDPETLTVAPPPSAPQGTQKIPALASTAGLGRGNARTPDFGDGEDRHPLFPVTSKDGGGNGSGAGSGSGIDRGLSAAYSKAQLISPLDFQIPSRYVWNLPEKDILLSVNVQADGSPGDISVVQSCGFPDLDNAFKEYVALHCKFRPAFDHGKAIASVEQIGQMFGNK